MSFNKFDFFSLHEQIVEEQNESDAIFAMQVAIAQQHFARNADGRG